MESFPFVLAEYKNERDDLARERYFRMLSDIDFIGSYFYRGEISTEPQYTPKIKRDFPSTKLNGYMF